MKVTLIIKMMKILKNVRSVVDEWFYFCIMVFELINFAFFWSHIAFRRSNLLLVNPKYFRHIQILNNIN